MRQPTVSSRYCDSGQNTVLAKPPNSVSAVTARRYDAPAIWCSVANAGSYRHAAIATPASSQPASTVSGPCAPASAAHASAAEQRSRDQHAAAAARVDLRGRRAGETSPDTNSPAVKLPNSHSSPTPVSARIAAPSTAIV